MGSGYAEPEVSQPFAEEANALVDEVKAELAAIVPVPSDGADLRLEEFQMLSARDRRPHARARTSGTKATPIISASARGPSATLRAVLVQRGLVPLRGEHRVP